MKPSTAKNVAYNLRASKQAERRILIDFLKCANEAGVTISDCRYVGMGGTQFYDFHLLHRFLGVKRMVSLERDDDMFKRSVFNCPYRFIKVMNNTVAEFIELDRDRTRTIYWLDYDDAISPEITTDINALGGRLKPSEFVLVTVYAEPPGALRDKNSEARLDYFIENLGEYSSGLVREDMENYLFPSTVHRILVAAFTRAFSTRRDGKFVPWLQIQYSDAKQMITVGGCFCGANAENDISTRVKRDLPFLTSDTLPYHIKYLNLTERERALFDIAVTMKGAKSKQISKLETLGFKERDFRAYKELIRFLPRYYESII
jgi:hypothetical protein